MERSDLDKDSLKIGDHIFLKDVALGFYLFVEGILLEDVCGSEEFSSLHDVLFCVHYQRQYSAARELNAFLAKYDSNRDNIKDESEKKYLLALERGRDNENALNDQYLKKKMGQVVLFGDTIQLYHVRSGKYLQVLPNKLARDEKDNVRIGLDSSGDAYSWIQICPRFKIDREGDRILSNAEVYLKVAERGTEYVHTALKEAPAGSMREMNCSLETTSWRLNIFQSCLDTIDRGILLANQLVYLGDPETKSFFNINEPKLDSFDDHHPESENGDHEFLEPEVVLMPTVMNHLDTNYLWFIEGASQTTGGPFKWKTDQIRFRHFNSGRYLMCETVMDYDEEGLATKRVIFVVTRQSDNPGTFFNVSEVNSQAKYLGNGKAVQIGHNGVWIERGDVMEGSMFTFGLLGSKEKGNALNMVIQRHKNAARSGETDDGDDYIDPSVRFNEPLDVFVGLSIRNYLQRYYDMTVVSTGSTGMNTIWPSASRADIETFKVIVEKVVGFVLGHPIGTVMETNLMEVADTKVMISRQSLLKEQGAFELVLRFIHKLMPIMEIAESRKTKVNTDRSFLFRMTHLVLHECFSIMFNLLKEHPANQMYAADFMPLLLANLSSQPLAVECVTEMLSKNLELQETKIGTREIQIFVDKLKASELNTMYLQLLQSCCSCQGEGVDGNQCKVANMLFDSTDRVIIALSADYLRCFPVDWNEKNSLYIPRSSEFSVRGEGLLSRGLPSISLQWLTTEEDSSNHIASLEELFESGAIFQRMDEFNLQLSGKSSMMAGSIKQRHMAAQQRQEIARYFIAEMFLGAEMCMNRNYVAMQKLDDLFPYDVLLTILRLDVASGVKAAAARLLMCLHVDRDPQASTKIPCLTRSWSDVRKHTEPQLPFVDPNRQFTFGIIQHLISEHVREMQGKKWDAYSMHMLKMLRTLITFNFYGTNERMKDVIEPLIAALDRRNVNVEVSQGGGTSRGGSFIKPLSNGSRASSKRSKSFMQEILEEDEDGMDAPTGKVGSAIAFISQAQDGFDGDDNGDDDASLSSRLRLRKSEKYSGSKRNQYLKLLQRVESTEATVAFLVVLSMAVGLDIYQVVSDESFQDFTIVGIVELVLLAGFVVEMLVRMYAHWRVHDSVYSFLRVPLNALDFAVVVANIVLYLTSPAIDHGASFIKVARFARALTFVKITKDAKVDVVEGAEVKVDQFIVPKRYSSAPGQELETMVEAVTILAFVQQVIEDRNLSLFLRNFYLWESGAERKTPSDVFEQVITETDILSLRTDEFEYVMIDLLMYSYGALVQSTLEVLMAFYSKRSLLLEHAQGVQLLASSKREQQLVLVNQMLKELEQNAETHELWGELATDSDRATSLKTKEIIKKLTDNCRIRRQVLEFDEDFMADSEIQDLYRNLGCFEICMKVMGLLDSVEEDENGELGEVALNTRDLCLLCNTLLYWLLLGNPKNQQMGYQELDFFLDSLDGEINSHLVLIAIFKDNEALMRQIPHTYLAELVDRIIKNGKSHHYLALFSAITNVGERNVLENQFEIVKSLTSPGRLQKVACFFVPIDHPDYEEKRKLMAPFLETTRDLSLEDLPPLLSYHLMFLEVLSGCTVGRMDLRTVEAKVQSVFSYADMLQSILDPGTIVACKIRLSKFFYNSVIEVELRITGLEQSAYIWQLLQSYTVVLNYAKDEIRTVEKLGWDAEEVSRQRIEYIIVSIMIIGGFFERYYDPKTFHFSDGSVTHASRDKVQISLQQANDLVDLLFRKIKEIYDIDSPRLSAETKEMMFLALEALNFKCPGKVLCTNLVRNGVLVQSGGVREQVTAESKLLEKYNGFVEQIVANPSVQKSSEMESVAFITLIESFPSIKDDTSSELRYESIIQKLVAHIRDNITIKDSKKFMDHRVTKTAIWIIRAFRTMIENRMGMSIYERDDEGGQEQDIAAAPVVNALNSCGGTALCLDLIADGIDEKLQLEAVRLGVGLLFKEGGALEVQTLMNTHLSKPGSELFFKQVRITLQKLKAWHEWNEIIVLEEGQEPKPPDEILIVRFLQLMCEGHYLPNQNIMREQPNNSVNFNILDDFVLYLNCLSRLPCRTSTVAAIRVSATILEVIQGPCEGNQVHFALNTELIETLNRLNRAKMTQDSEEDEEVELKKTSIDIFQGLLEGQGEKSVVYERVLSVIHLDIIQMMSKGQGIVSDIGDEMAMVAIGGSSLKHPEIVSEDKVILQTECVVLLQMLCNFKPSLYEELGISQNIEEIVGSGTAMIEVIWRGDIHRRFFHIPSICSFLAKSSKDELVENVDRSTAENKLIDFLGRSHGLYREVKHQQLLTEMNLSRVFSLENKNRATWLTFYLAVIINVMFVGFYTASDGTPTVQNPVALTIINALNIVQVIIAAFVLALSLFVRTPVLYQMHDADGHSPMNAMLYSAMDPQTVYMIMYLVLSLLGVLVADYFLPFLLLDIVAKNATTRDILNAVIIPYKQLAMTVVLAVFVNYIYAFFVFKNHRDELGSSYGPGVDEGSPDCATLWGCYKFVLCYGLRQGGGIGEVMSLSIGWLWLTQFTYFLIVIVMLLNIIFGIIIDTFSSLRAQKNERLVDTAEVCFICGIDKQVFDRASEQPDGFQAHVKLDHNMWNYLYYIFLLWEQDRDDDDGLEQYVRKAIDAGEISWFPIRKAIRLDQAASEEEVTCKEIGDSIDAMESAFTTKISALQTEMTSILEQWSQAAKQEYASGEAKAGIARFLQEHALLEASADDVADQASQLASLAADSLTEVEDGLDDLDELAREEDGGSDVFDVENDDYHTNHEEQEDEQHKGEQHEDRAPVIRGGHIKNMRSKSADGELDGVGEEGDFVQLALPLNRGRGRFAEVDSLEEGAASISEVLPSMDSVSVVEDSNPMDYVRPMSPRLDDDAAPASEPLLDEGLVTPATVAGDVLIDQPVSPMRHAWAVEDRVPDHVEPEPKPELEAGDAEVAMPSSAFPGPTGEDLEDTVESAPQYDEPVLPPSPSIERHTVAEAFVGDLIERGVTWRARAPSREAAEGFVAGLFTDAARRLTVVADEAGAESEEIEDQ